MKQEDKDLLLRDLSTRLPYSVKVHIKGEYHKYHKIEEIDINNECVRYFENWHLYEEKIINCRLYLRPMSSMTKEEVAEFESISDEFLEHGISEEIWNTVIDWLNAHHFDHRHLIEKGLALEAPKDMYLIESKE